MEEMSIPLRAIAHEPTELEFHIPPVSNSSRPQVGAGIAGRSSRIRRSVARCDHDSSGTRWCEAMRGSATKSPMVAPSMMMKPISAAIAA